MEILWSVEALVDLENIRKFLAEGEYADPVGALDICHYLYSYPEQQLMPRPDLSFPRRGRQGLHPATLELPVPRYSNYVITYIPFDTYIEIVGIRDCRRKPGKRPGDD